MRDKRVLLGMLLSVFAFGGLCSAASSTLSLGTNVTPDIRDRNSRFEFRTTTTYDSRTYVDASTGNKLFVGATDVGANEYAVSMLNTSDSGATIDKTALAPALIYGTPSDTAAALITNPVYNARIWEIAYFPCYGKNYIAAIVQASTDTGNGGSFVAVINVADPKETYVSGTAMTLDGEAAGTANTASKFVKLAVGDNQGVTTKVVFVAVADPVSGEFDTSKTTPGLRAYTAPSSSLANNSLVELDMLSGAGKGVKLGSSAAMMAINMKRLTSMAWDITNKVLYLGGYMTGGTMGICGFYLASSDVLTSLNNSTGGTLLNGNAAASIIPELSNVHRLTVSNLGGTVPHLIVQSGVSPDQKSNFYSMALTVTTGSAATLGKLAQTTTNVVAVSRATSWLAVDTNGAYFATGKPMLTKLIPGNAPFAAARAVITDVKVVGTKLYVTTTNANNGSEAWVTTATVTSNFVASWTGWQKIADTSLAKVTGFATNGTYIWSVIDRKSVYVSSTTATAAAVAQASVGLANVKDSASHTRLRQAAVFDAVNRVLISAHATAPGAGVCPVNTFSPATGVTAAPTGEAAVSAILNKSIWDVVTMTNSGVVDKYYLLNDTAVNTQGGRTIIKVPGDGSTAIVFNTASFFQDSSSVASHCVKIVAGQDTSGTNRLFCFIADAALADAVVMSAGGTGSLAAAAPTADVIKVLDKDLGVVAASLQIGDATNLPGLRPTTGNNTPADVTTIQSVYFDYTLKVLYVGFQMASGITKPGLVALKLTSAPALTGYMVFTSNYNGSTLGTDDSIRDVYRIASLRTAGTTPRSILITAGTLTAQAGTTSAETGDVTTGGVYAIPVITASGSNLGKAATGAGTYTTNAVATSTANMWNKSVSPSLFYVGGYTYNATAALAGGAYPWNIQAAVLDVQVIDLDVYVTVANSPGITGPVGVFRTTAVCDSAGALAGWTPWVMVSGLRDAMQNVAFDQTTASFIGLDLASGQPVVPSWKQSSESSAYDQLADALNSDFADQGGVYNISSHKATEGVVAANGSGSGATMNLVVATGNKRVALAHVGYKSSIVPQTLNNPNRADTYTYKSFLTDDALTAVGQIYCSTTSRGSSGWVFVGGKNGIAVLRVPGTVGGDAGKGWTTTVPSSLLDTTSSSNGLASMTWFKIPGITDSIRKMTVVYDKTAATEVVVAMGTTGVYAFVANAANLFDDTTANVPTIVSLTTAGNVAGQSAFTSDNSQRVWDMASLYHRGGNVLIGTTKGLYRVQFDAGAWGTPTEIVDSINSLSLGAVSSIHVVAPVLAAGSDLSVNPIFTVNCVTAKARTDAGNHYRFPITLVETTGAVSGTPAAVLVRALDRMVTQIIADGASTVYHAGKPTAKVASVDVLSKAIETSSAAVSGGLSAAKGSAMGRITIVGADGTKLVTVGGRVYVQSA